MGGGEFTSRGKAESVDFAIVVGGGSDILVRW